MIQAITKKVPLSSAAVRYFYAAVFLCIAFGVAIGFSIDEFYLERLSTPQVAFVDGVVAGAHYRTEFNAWKTENGAETDPRANPASRCASSFYPNNPNAMRGCLQAIDGRPPDGYNLP